MICCKIIGTFSHAILSDYSTPPLLLSTSPDRADFKKATSKMIPLQERLRR